MEYKETTISFTETELSELASALEGHIERQVEDFSNPKQSLFDDELNMLSEFVYHRHYLYRNGTDYDDVYQWFNDLVEAKE